MIASQKAMGRMLPKDKVTLKFVNLLLSTFSLKETRNLTCIRGS